MKFEIPRDRSLLRLSTRWKDLRFTRRVSVGRGECPPCDTVFKEKVIGAAFIEVSASGPAGHFTTGEQYFARVEVDPILESLLPGEVHLEGSVCTPTRLEEPADKPVARPTPFKAPDPDTIPILGQRDLGPSNFGYTQYKTPVHDCEALVLKPKSSLLSKDQVVVSFEIPSRKGFLRVSAQWDAPDVPRITSMGHGDCPPCIDTEVNRSLNSVYLEIPAGYASTGATAFHPGDRYYVRVRTDQESDRISPGDIVFEGQLCEVDVVADTTVPLLSTSFFPPQDLRTGSLVTIEKDAFGLSGFNGVDTAVYDRAGETYNVFVAVTPTEEQAKTLLADYAELLLSVGATEASLPGIPGSRSFALAGTTSIAFVQGGRIAGIQEATSGPGASALALELHAWLVSHPVIKSGATQGSP